MGRIGRLWKSGREGKFAIVGSGLAGLLLVGVICAIIFSREPSATLYRSPTLGFAAEYPSGWRVTDLAHGPCTDDPSRLCDAVLFQPETGDAFGNYYGLTVFRVWPAMGETITDTVEYSLRNLEPRDQIKTRCCLTIGGEPAMELTFPRLPEHRYGDHQIWVMHNGGEYTLTFWWNVPFQPGDLFEIPEGHGAQATFDGFLRTFTFIPIAETPTPPPPVLTPAPTPTRVPTPTSATPTTNLT